MIIVGVAADAAIVIGVCGWMSLVHVLDVMEETPKLSLVDDISL